MEGSYKKKKKKKKKKKNNKHKNQEQEMLKETANFKLTFAINRSQRNTYKKIRTYHKEANKDKK